MTKYDFFNFFKENDERIVEPSENVKVYVNIANKQHTLVREQA